jgi:Protein of unknown function (DUF2950)
MRPTVRPQTKSTLGIGVDKDSYSSKLLEDVMSIKPRSIPFTTQLLLLALIISLTACNKSDKPSTRVFVSPDDASNTLLAAAKSEDQNALLAILGPDSKEVIFSGDPVQDKNAAAAFAAGYAVMHRWRNMADGAQMLLVGADNFPFPIPLKQNAGGQWFFDTAAGKDEVLNRRIGRNELAVIEVCGAAAEAQAEYFSQLHDGDKTEQFATKFISDPGTQNGLYWKPAEGQPASPLGPLAAFATAEGYSVKPDAHAAFHGYYFHMLTKQSNNAPGGARDYMVNGKMTGGFAFVAYPVEYGNSGVMTFIINQDGVLLQKDLGKTTTETAIAMNAFDSDPSWTIVEPAG